MGLMAGGVDRPAQPMVEPRFLFGRYWLEVGDRARQPGVLSGGIIDMKGWSVTINLTTEILRN